MFLRHRRRKAREAKKDESFSDGVRLLAYARTVRWIGWGFAEALLPVFILSFSNTFAQMGLFSSTVDIASLASLPMIGLWADKVPARRLVLWSLALYPLVGISYFFAGALGAAIFIVIARIVNGVTFELENVGIETYYRRRIKSEKIASSFGYLESMSHVAWISAALAGIFLIRFFPIHYLLFLIAPFSVIAYFLVLRAPSDAVGADDKPREKISFVRSYGKTFSEWGTWNRHLWLLSVLVLFSSIVDSLVYFFLPIDAYLTGANLPMVVLITVFGAIPALFGFFIGKAADRANKYAVIAVGLVGTTVVFAGLALISGYWFKLVAVFLMGIILELFYVAEGSLVTTLGPAETYGERGGAFESIAVLSDLVSPLILGVGLDVLGFGQVAVAIAAAAFLLAVAYRMNS